mmetsp:Transcript_45998/g.77333  ORF Transcript_45998/g.77333 Transcript_45998/m.77333 type:complete len:327 (-) Transcript_45998:808-1788(-)
MPDAVVPLGNDLRHTTPEFVLLPASLVLQPLLEAQHLIFLAGLQRCILGLVLDEIAQCHNRILRVNQIYSCCVIFVVKASLEEGQHLVDIPLTLDRQCLQNGLYLFGHPILLLQLLHHLLHPFLHQEAALRAKHLQHPLRHIAQLFLLFPLMPTVIHQLLFILSIVRVRPEIQNRRFPLHSQLLLKHYAVGLNAGVDEFHRLLFVHLPHFLVLVGVRLLKILEFELQVLVLLSDPTVLLRQDVVLMLELLIGICVFGDQPTEHILKSGQLSLVVLDRFLILLHSLTQHPKIVLQLLSIELIQSPHFLKLLLQPLDFLLQLHLQDVV